ncbi:MAG: glycosyltransferase [Bacteroidota bacterium]|nr:glycosyltransferase [Bacteroidota bacterium]
MKRIIISVTSDLCTDQRVHKVATTLSEMGFDILLVGRKLPDSSLIERKYKTKRFKLLFNEEVWFYMEYNIRLFFFLLFSKVDVLLANDLDTLLPNFLVSKLKNKPLVYDSHEMFCEGPELQDRTVVKLVWRAIEKTILPEIKYAYTVSQSIADAYKHQYGVDFRVNRNIPKLVKTTREVEQLNFEGKKIILYQGVMNPGRGLEEMIAAMPFIDDAVLLIIGFGKVEGELKRLVKDKHLDDKVIFFGKVPFEDLLSYSIQADVGLLLERSFGLSFTYALPNKLFDYIHAELPIIASSLIEVKSIMQEYDIGKIAENHNPEYLAETVNEILSNNEKRKYWKQNMQIAKKELNWEREQEKIRGVYAEFL